MTKRNPNWFSAACGLAYCVCFLFMTVYKVPLWSFTGAELLSETPLLILLLVCGLAMIISAIALDHIISIGIGAGSALITLIFGLLGKHVLPVGAITSSIDQNLYSLLGTDVNVGGFVSVKMGVGLIICLLLCIAHIVLEVLMGQRKPRRIQANLWEETRNDNISF